VHFYPSSTWALRQNKAGDRLLQLYEEAIGKMVDRVCDKLITPEKVGACV
jgi:hypothetical protein